LTAAGPGLIGAFGAGAIPVIRRPDTVVDIDASDWRVAELKLQGSNQSPSIGLSLSNGKTHNLVYLTEIDSYEGELLADHFNPGTSGVVECVLGPSNAPNGSYGFFGGAENLSLLGNQISGMNGGHTQHNVRVFNGDKLVISHNKIGPSPNVHNEILMNQDNGNRARFSLVSDNHLHHGSGYGGFTCCGGGLGGVFENVRWDDVVFENNFITTTGAHGTVKYVTVVNVQGLTVRNNMFVLDDIDASIARIQHNQEGDGPQAANEIEFYNNSVYTTNDHGFIPGTSNPLLEVFDGRVTNVVLRNNVMWSAKSASQAPTFTSCGSSPGCIDSKNWDRHDGELTASPFVSGAPVIPDDFKLSGSSSLIDRADTVNAVSIDFFRGMRNGPMDIGAVEHGATLIGGGTPPPPPGPPPPPVLIGSD
jgi:hypothetical protein